MARKVKFLIKPEDQLGDRLIQVGEMVQRGLKSGPVVVILTREQRTEPQNDLIHPVVREVSKHMMEHGAPKRTEEWWRYYFLGKWQGQEILPDPAGGETFIVLNKMSGTSGLTKEQATEFIEWLYAFGTEIGMSYETTT